MMAFRSDYNEHALYGTPIHKMDDIPARWLAANAVDATNPYEAMVEILYEPIPIDETGLQHEALSVQQHFMQHDLKRTPRIAPSNCALNTEATDWAATIPANHADEVKRWMRSFL